MINQVFDMAVNYEKDLLKAKDEISQLKADKARLIEAIEQAYDEDDSHSSMDKLFKLAREMKGGE